jgi:putative thioredoxin
MPHAYDITEADFDTAVLARSREVPVLVDFWAPWCRPCRSLKPLLEKLAGEYGGRFELAKLNSDEAPSVSARYAVRSIPAVKLFVDGEVVDEFTGALPEGRCGPSSTPACPTRPKIAPAGGHLADPLARAELLNQAADLSGGRPEIVLDLVAALLDAGLADYAAAGLDSIEPRERDELAEIEGPAGSRPRPGRGGRAALDARIAADPKDFEARFALATLRPSAKPGAPPSPSCWSRAARQGRRPQAGAGQAGGVVPAMPRPEGGDDGPAGTVDVLELKR